MIVKSITDNDDGSCNIEFEMTESVKNSLASYAIKTAIYKACEEVLPIEESLETRKLNYLVEKCNYITKTALEDKYHPSHLIWLLENYIKDMYKIK